MVLRALRWIRVCGVLGLLMVGSGCGDDTEAPVCGNGKIGLQEECDCGQDPEHLPLGCAAPNGVPGSTCTDTCRLVPPEDCFNGGVDDDLDGLADCEDPDCAGHPRCVAETCDDGVDNNGDGLLDCEDPDCAGAVVCVVEVCDNGVDDNQDGHEDCQDVDCFSDPGCAGVEVCWNGLDDDGNGYVDCEDPQCAERTECTMEVCDNGVDDDSDGRIDCADRGCIERTPCDQTGCTTQVDETVTLDASGAAMAQVTADVATAGDDLEGPCDVTFGQEYVVAVNLVTAGRLQVVYQGQGRHKVGLYFKGGPGSGCTAALGAPCETTALGGSGVIDYGVLPSSKYFLVVAEAAAGQGGQVTLTLSLQDPSQPEELCNNLLDDDGNGQVDCGDIACYDLPGLCENPSDCTADALGAVDLGPLDVSGGPVAVDVTGLDTRLETNDWAVGCGGGGGTDALYRFHLDVPAVLQVGWSQQMDQHGDHVFSLQFPAGGCSLMEHICLDPQGTGAGIGQFPGNPGAGGLYPAGDYYLVVESLLGHAGRVDFQILALPAAAEVCDDWGYDNDGDGLANCDDPDCSAHPLCLREDCHNGVDDDNDGLVDCQDQDPDDPCVCSYFCRGRQSVCDVQSDPEILDLGVLAVGAPAAFDIDTTGAQADYVMNVSCTIDATAPDRVLAFELTSYADVSLTFTDTGDHVGVLYAMDPCQPCVTDAGYVYCFGGTSPWERPFLPPGRYAWVVRPRVAGSEGRFSGTLLAQ